MEGGIFIFYEQFCLLHETLCGQIQEVRRQLTGLPEGRLVCARNGGKYKWYQSLEGGTEYIPKERRKFAGELALKTYLALVLEDLVREEKALYRCVSAAAPQHGKVGKLLENPEFLNLLGPSFAPVSEQLASWAAEPYSRNCKYPDRLSYKTLNGDFVRSKSEMLIHTVLFQNKIPFRYECELVLGGVTLYPDFVIRHPRTGEVYYWEHFGRMDDPAYNKAVPGKLQLYISNGVIPDIQLITTFETKEHPLSIDKVQRIVEEYFGGA